MKTKIKPRINVSVFLFSRNRNKIQVRLNKTADNFIIRFKHTLKIQTGKIVKIALVAMSFDKVAKNLCL